MIDINQALDYEVVKQAVDVCEPILSWSFVRHITAEAEQKDQVVPFIQSPLYDPNLWYDILSHLASSSRTYLMETKSGARIPVCVDEHFKGLRYIAHVVRLSDGRDIDCVPVSKFRGLVEVRCPLRRSRPTTTNAIDYNDLE